MSEIILRPYQEQAISKLLWAQDLTGNDLCILPTGSGKSIVIAHLSKRLNQPILILQPSKEILEQNLAKLSLYVDRENIGVYSASMNEKVVKHFTFATIQSIYKKPELFNHFKLVIIDECHLVNVKNLTGMFTTFLKAIGSPKVVGFTATPYRMDTGYERLSAYEYRAFTTIKLINRVKHFFWNRVVFNVNNHELLEQGYLAPLEYVDRSIVSHEDLPMNKTRSDFDLVEYEKKISSRQRELLQGVNYARENANSVLAFCSSVGQAETLSSLTPGSAVVSAKTSKKEREKIIKGFKSQDIPVVYNVGVLTTGFDHPELDSIVLMRPTRSIALYYQMLGRGVRVAPGKTSCKVIDMTSTVQNIGRVETIRLEKIDNKWELLSEAGSWHGRELYSFVIEKKH